MKICCVKYCNIFYNFFLIFKTKKPQKFGWDLLEPPATGLNQQEIESTELEESVTSFASIGLLFGLDRFR